MDAAEGTRAHGRRALRAVMIVLAGLATVAIGLGGLAFVATGWLHATPEPGAEAGGNRDAVGAVGASTDRYTVWERNDDGRPVRWDACSPVELVVAWERAPVGAATDLEVAVSTLREASGLDLVVTGATDERPRGERPPFQPERYGPRWAPVLVAWASPGDGGLPLRDTDRGVAIPIAVGPPGDRTYVSGQVVLNTDRNDLRPGNADRADSWGATILHELAHVLGLGHVDEPRELMYVFPGEGPVELGEGDRAGLRAVGTGGGCLEVPAPRPLDVALPAGR